MEQLTLDKFAPLVGTSFVVSLDGPDDAELELKLTHASSRGPGPPPGRGEPFSLVFAGPAEPLLAQRTYRFEHADTGALEIFVVPIAQDEAGARYEAVFS